MLFEKSCGAVVFGDKLLPDGTKKRYVLMIKQSPASHFSFPKGHVEAGEEERQTAVREVFEETGVRIEITESFRRAVYYSPRPGTRKQVVYFTAMAEVGETLPREGEIYRAGWIEAERAMRLLAHSNDKKVFAMASGYMKKQYQIKTSPFENGGKR